MSALVQTLGGVGFFLFGMMMMTSGLRKLAGDRLRVWLARATKTPVSGAAVGAAVTALIQSSSATTLAAVGFVGAGLMSFTASLGIIFGANIGTTLTGWMVTILGFELKLTSAALPLLFVAALCYLFKQIRTLRAVGKALGGFCLVFIGISYLQVGLEQYRDLIDLSQWSATSFGGRLLLVLIGIVLTLITQSSSATVATALTALNASVLDLPQAAAVIIGADIGTTGTAALATIGGTTASRRTGFAHVIYNLLTGITAFFLLPLYLMGVAEIWPTAISGSAEIVAVGFHSAFNCLGVVLALPFTRPFGRFIERLFPERNATMTALFDPQLLEDPSAARAGLESGCLRIAAAALRQGALSFDPEARQDAKALSEATDGVAAGRDFAVKVGARGGDAAASNSERVFDCIHLLDHVERFVDRLRDERSIDTTIRDADLRVRADELVSLSQRLVTEIEEGRESNEVGVLLARAADELDQDKPHFRQRLIRAAATEESSGDQLDSLLDADRLLRRVTYHAARIAHYSSRVRFSSPRAE